MEKNELTSFISSGLEDIKRVNFSNEPGVYILYRKGHTSQRYNKKDNTGLIYIGSSSNLQQRIISLKNGVLRNNPRIHSINKRLNSYFTDSQDLGHYFIKYQYLKSVEKSKEKEKELIEKYFQKYLDLPILNSKR